ncbi:MAG: hypothetical protein KY460_03215, partial [Actinobacteria bacterium]|nr:hypothetical protein [Actinomycetota bacterium]
MDELWVSGDRAPLRAAERDSPSSLQYIGFTADTALLHPTRRSATALATGGSITLADDLGAGGLFELLDESMLIVGAPGAGKSVLLWQI